MAHIEALLDLEVDPRVIFNLSDRVPGPLLNLYLIHSFSSRELFDEIEGFGAPTLERFFEHGLGTKQPLPEAPVRSKHCESRNFTRLGPWQEWTSLARRGMR